MNKKDKKIIDDYFSDKMVKYLLKKELGANGRISVDWEKRKVRADGNLASKEWDLDEMLKMLKNEQI